MFPPPVDLPPELVRIEVPDYPNAVSYSASASITLSPPEDDLPWRYESMAIVDEEAISGSIADHNLLQLIGAEKWHDAGYMGQGVSIAVIDAEWFGPEWVEDELGNYQTHDCFAHRSCELAIDPANPRYNFENGRHGIACAEVIKDIAPKANIHLVRAAGVTSLENAVAWAIREDIDIISMSLSFFNESFYDGTGPVSKLMDQLRAADILMVTSAGNYAKQHYLDDFRDNDLNNWHEFQHGSEYLPIYYTEGVYRLNLIWNEFSQCGKTDLDAYIWSRDGKMVGRGSRIQDPESKSCHPSERIRVTIENEDWHWLQIRRKRGVGNVKLDIMARSGTLYHKMPEGSIVDPGVHPSVFTVGAVREDDYLLGAPESFSSQGPTNGGYLKPDIVGPDRIDSSSYGPSGFYGTSASTPVVAAAVALMMSKDPSVSPYDIAIQLKNNAIPDIDHWNKHSNEIGAGKLYMPSPTSDRGCGSEIAIIPMVFWSYRRRYRKNRLRYQSVKK